MTQKQIVKTSKFLSLVLRHRPEVIGINLDAHGWVDVNELIDKSNANGREMNFELLQAIVKNNNKKRFAFNEDLTKIRASQGHSVEIELGYLPCNPPNILYHGTATRFIDSILKNGLIKGNRHHVHLSKDKETASNVGRRHGKLVILEVDAKSMHEKGCHFYVSENSVWLTENVPSEYLKEV
jgi:putative RNA 2'-phosphotransferase